MKRPKTCPKPPCQTFTVTFTAIFTAVTTAVTVVYHFGSAVCEHSVTAVNVTVNKCWGCSGQVSGCPKRGQLQVGWSSARIMEHFNAGCADLVALCCTFCNMCQDTNRDAPRGAASGGRPWSVRPGPRPTSVLAGVVTLQDLRCPGWGSVMSNRE